MAIGLDIGSKTLKIVELIRDSSAFRLNSAGILGYNDKPPEKTETEKDLAPLAAAIRKLYKEARIAGREVVLSIPESLAYTRSIKFPLMTDAEIASAVKWEAEQYIPIPLNEAIIQHTVLSRNENVTPPDVSVLLVAVSKKIVEKYIKSAEMAGLKPVAIETELIALSRSLGTPDSTAIVVDIGATSTDIGIIKSSKLIISRSISTAGEAFTRAISQNLGIPQQQAEEYKRTYGLSSNQLEGKIKTTLEPVFKVVADEMKKTIFFYQSEEKAEAPRTAILSGGSSLMLQFSAELTSALNMEVVLANPFQKVSVEQSALKSLSGYAPVYAIATGLAMREDV